MFGMEGRKREVQGIGRGGEGGMKVVEREREVKREGGGGGGREGIAIS